MKDSVYVGNWYLNGIISVLRRDAGKITKTEYTQKHREALTSKSNCLLTLS